MQEECPHCAIEADQGASLQSPLKKHMETEGTLVAVAYKMIATFGDQAVERMDSIVSDHIAAKDTEGATFWGDVASTVRRLQAGVSVAEKGEPDGDH